MAELRFEESLKQLEKIVEELEKGNLPLDTSLKKYEEGVRLSHLLTRRLEQAQKRVEQLMKADAGKFETKAFETDAGEAEET